MLRFRKFKEKGDVLMNIHDIAKLAGVSVSTVSKVMNGKDKDISEKTKQLDTIKQAIIGNINDLSAISEENAASNQEVSANITNIAESIDEMNAATGHVNNISEELAQLMEYFK